MRGGMKAWESMGEGGAGGLWEGAGYRITFAMGRGMRTKRGAGGRGVMR